MSDSRSSSDAKDTSRRFSKDVAVVEEDGLEKSVLTTSTGETVFTIDPAAEKRLLWKFDLRILPILATMVKSLATLFIKYTLIFLLVFVQRSV